MISTQATGRRSDFNSSSKGSSEGVIAGALLTLKLTLPWVTLLMAWAASPAVAQIRFGSLGGDKPTVFAIAPREATRPVKIAAASIENGDFAQATDLLGDLLADPILNQYMVPDPTQWGRAISLRQKTEQMLGQIPIDQRQSYEEKYGVRASVLLKQAVADNDIAGISAVSRLYFYTRAGQEATMLMGHSHLAQGRAVMAAAAFEKIASHDQGRQRFDPEATLLAAIGWSLNGSTQKADRLLRDLKRRTNEKDVTFYGQPVPLFDQDAPLQRWLKQAVAATPLQSHPVVRQWLMYRGDRKRNAESGSGFPLLSPRWSVRTITDPNDESGIQAFQQELIQAKISPMPKIHPLAIGDTLVIRTDDAMFGIAANSGKRLWSYPPADVFRSQAKMAMDADNRSSRSVRQDKLRERLWLDALYGQISSDGDSIFLIPNPGVSTDRDDWRRYQRQSYDEPTDLRMYNELKSLDLQQQGSLQWQVGGESGLDEPKLAKSFFLGAPLPIGDRLYAICLQEQSVRLVVLESETGRLVWARHLASTEEAVSFREDRLRRLAGATPSESNGVLICPTGLNAIVAVDVATESLMWGFQFKTPSRTRVDRLTDQLSKWNTIWRDATVTLTESAVVYTPTSSDEVYCLDLQTGDALWRNERNSRSRLKYKAMHVEAIRGGEIILTSSDRIKAVNIETGRVSWNFELGDYGLVSGRGYISGDDCYVPTTTKKILRINARTGSVEGVAMTEKVLGNLICFQGDVISHGADHLTAYPRDQPSRLMIANATPEQLDDHRSLSVQAQLHLLDGEYSRSVDAISLAYDRFPNSNYAKVLVQALTRLIEADFAKAERVCDRYQGLFQTEDLQRLLRGKVSGLLKLNRPAEAWATLIEILETVDLDPVTPEPVAQRIDDEQSVTMVADAVDEAHSLAKGATNSELTMQLNQWLRWKLSQVYHDCGEDLQNQFRSSVASHLANYADAPLIQRHDRIRLMPSAAVGETERLSLAAELYQAKLYVRAASVAFEFSASWGGQGIDESGIGNRDEIADRRQWPVVARGAYAVLRRMKAGGFSGDSIEALENTIADMIGAPRSDIDLRDPDYYQPSSSLSASSSARSSAVSPRLNTDDLQIQWNRQVSRIAEQPSATYYISAQHVCDVVTTDQSELESLLLVYSDDFRELKLHDRLGRLVQKIYLDPAGDLQGTKQGTRGRIYLRQSLMLLCIDEEMYALDWEKLLRGQPALLWSADNVTCSSSGIADRPLEGIHVLSDGVLMCLDPFTGQTLWQRTQVSKRSALLQGPTSLTVWNRSERTYDLIDPAAGRLLVSGRIDRYGGAASVAVENLQLLVVTKQPTANAVPQYDDTPSNTNADNRVDASEEKNAGVESVLNMFDFDQQKFIWSKTMAGPAHTALVDPDRLLVLSREGVFSLIDVPTGEFKFQTKVEDLNDQAISGISVEKFNGRYLVSVHSITQQAEYVIQDDVRVTFQRMHRTNAMLNGYLVALDTKTGRAMWDAPVQVQRFQLLEGLPWDCPFAILTRKNVYESDTTRVRVQLAMVDLKSGRLKANEVFKVPVRDDVFYQVVCRPDYGDDSTQSIDIQIATLQLRVELANFLTAPQPIAALTNPAAYKPAQDDLVPTVITNQQTVDFEALVEKAVAAAKERERLSQEEARLIETEMKDDR